jgi:hypothetical protein
MKQRLMILAAGVGLGLLARGIQWIVAVLPHGN